MIKILGESCSSLCSLYFVHEYFCWRQWDCLDSERLLSNSDIISTFPFLLVNYKLILFLASINSPVKLMGLSLKNVKMAD